MSSSHPLFIDFEASSLSLTDSYPIQVAFSIENNAIQNYLINPSSVKSWTDWNPEAEKVHQLSRKQLTLTGQPPRDVALKMNELLKRNNVYCNGFENDKFWLGRLFSSAEMSPSFNIKDFFTLIPDGLFQKTSQDFPALYSVMAKLARQAVSGRTHDAANDVQYLVNLYRIVCNYNHIKEVGFGVFNDNEDCFMEWLQSSLKGLSKEIPVSYLQTEEGVGQIKGLLRKMKCGEYI